MYIYIHYKNMIKPMHTVLTLTLGVTGGMFPVTNCMSVKKRCGNT